jgi:poly-gamma-glutamate capsule biosynthesis protein CapA/YwtB (metallophosphatase superfamily)
LFLESEFYRGTVQDSVLTVFLCGDVMLGRGVDQILPNPGDPTLQERYVRDARTYVQFAEGVNGPIPHPVDYGWPWGYALDTLDAVRPDVRIINLETSVTTSDDFAPGKGVHYRMTPQNVPALTIAQPDACVLANNHVMDFGYLGLAETMRVLSMAGLTPVGIGHDADEARHPVMLPVKNTRLIIFAYGMATSGVPPSWAAAPTRPGVNFMSGPSEVAAKEVIAQVQAVKQPGDVVIVSVHWGGNWGYDVSRDEVHFAHRLIDGGVDVLHGHSSHHPRPIEVYQRKLILYGCGDFIDDYEGISGYEKYRDDLRLMYLASIDPGNGELRGLRMVTLQARRMRLEPAWSDDVAWLRQVLDRVSRPFGSYVEVEDDQVAALRLGWERP